MIHLYTGGARSGKSRAVQEHAEREVPGGTLGFVATALAGDDDMSARIRQHQADRGARWRTFEEPTDLCTHLVAPEVDGLVIDCLTLWVYNLMVWPERPGTMDDAAVALAEALRRCPVPVWLVTNEVGLGIVPADSLSRDYRDHLGRTNQRIAAVADRVTFMVAGLPLRVK